jgi:CRISPR-associated protein Csm5
MPYHVESAIIELETLTPLFIKGKEVNYGEGMLRGSDGNVYLIDNDKLCDYIAEKNKIDEYVSYFDVTPNNEISLNKFLKINNIFPKNDELISISKGVTNIPDKEKSENKFIQNGNGKRFIPGSSIKGAIRNAILWKILSDTAKRIWLNKFVSHNLSHSHKDKKKYAEHFSDIPNTQREIIDDKSFTETIPKKVVTQNATQAEKKEIDEFNNRWNSANDTLRDFFRIVKISDANFEGKVVLKNELAKAVCKDASGTPPKNQSYQKRFYINLECASVKTKARFKISIDHNLAKDFFPSGSPFYLQSVSNLLKTVDEFFRAVAQFEETDFYNGLTSIPTDISPTDNRNAKLKVHTQQVFELYKSIFNLTPNSLLFRTGWGGGFMSKTQFLHLTMADRVKIRDLVRYNGSPIAPKSRCLIVNGENAVTPLGWCKLTILLNGELLGIDDATVIEASTEERPQRNTPNQRNFQNKPATEKEIAQSKAEANKIVKQAVKTAPKSVSHKVGNKIEMKVIQSTPLKSLTLEKGSDKLTVESNKMKQVGESVRVEVLEVKEGKITKVKLL